MLKKLTDNSFGSRVVTDLQSPAVLLVVLIFFIFLVELFLMVLLRTLSLSISVEAENLLDATLLVVILSPLLYFFLFRPLTAHITERNKTEAERERLAAIIECTTDFVSTADQEGRVLYINHAGRRMVGMDENQDLSNLRIPNLHPEWAVNIILKEGIPAALREGVWQDETAMLNRGGKEIPVSQVIMAHKAPDGTVAFLSTIIRDISGQKWAEEALKSERDKLKNILDSMADGVYIVNKQSDIEYVNPVIEKEFGPVKGRKCYEYFHDLNEVCAWCKSSEVFSGKSVRWEWYSSKAGKTYDLFDNQIRNADGSISKLEVFHDISVRKQAEESLRNSEERYRHLLGSLTDYFYTVKIENELPVFTSHGPGCVAVTGYTSDEYEVDPDLWYRMVCEDDRKSVIAQSVNILSGKDVQPLEHRIVHKDGSIRWVRNTPVPRFNEEGRLIAYDGLVSDITERRKLEEQLRHSQKMEVIGTLAGGIAHDFNNILTAMMGYASLLKMEIKKDEPSSHHAEQILVLAEKAANLTQGLLAFSRKQIINPKPTDLDEVIKRVEKILQRLIGEDIELKVILADKKLSVLVDSGQIEQVLMNLCANARDAMPGGGSLTIETDFMELGGEYTNKHGYGEPGHYVLVSVTDTGTGIDEKTKEKIFEPFFTTKDLGKGTGLGLSMAYGIIKQHNGYINVSSELGEGTRFDIYLPSIEPAEVGEKMSQGQTVSVGGTETILYAEDELFLREATKEVLEEFGYKIIAAVDGEDAIDKFMKNGDDIDLLLLDAIMPKKNGKQVYEETRKIRPDIKVVFLSGYAADSLKNKDIAEEGLTLISKPVSPAELLKKIREVLDR